MSEKMCFISFSFDLKETLKRQTQFATSFHADAMWSLWFRLKLWACFIREKSIQMGILSSPHSKLTHIKWVGKYVISHVVGIERCVVVILSI